jgi:hypothetical protein
MISYKKLMVLPLSFALFACGADGPSDGIEDDSATTSGGSTANCPAQAGGTSANRIVVDISWPETLGVEAGSGQLIIFTKADLEFDGNDVTGTVRTCGSIVPPLTTKALIGGHKVQPLMPDTLWDMPGLPTTAANGRVSGFNAGATISMDPAGVALGVQMADIIDGSWPESWSDLSTTDPDGDGKPGISAASNTSDGFSAPPLGILPDSPKAEILYLATRSVIELHGTRDSCSTASGKAIVHKFDNHVVGCTSTNGQDCTPSETDFVDANRVVYTIGEASYQMKQVDPNASCAEIRATFN